MEELCSNIDNENNFSGNSLSQTATNWSFLEVSRKRKGTKSRQFT